MSTDTRAELAAQLKLTITDAALEKVKATMGDLDLAENEQNLRIYVQGGGCGGPSFGMAFDAAEENDLRLERGGLPVLVDMASAPYVHGAEIDFVVTPEVTGFKVTNPTLASSCASDGCSPDSCGSAPPGGGCC